MSTLKVNNLQTVDGSFTVAVADLATGGGGVGGVTAHSALTGLGGDDHPQYLNNARGDARYVQPAALSAKQDTLVSGTNIKTVNGNSLLGSGDLVISGGGGGGVTDHGALTGLGDDDHTQYLNNTRGDARYSQLGHGHAIADVTGLQTALDAKQAALVNGTNIKTVNGNSLLGSGDLVISGGGGGGGLTLVVVSATTQSVTAGNEYALTNIAATTITGPASAGAGDRFAWNVCNGRTDNVINWNGLKHENLSDATMTIEGPNESGEAVYINATYGWKVK